LVDTSDPVILKRPFSRWRKTGVLHAVPMGQVKVYFLP
jgi:hypothetical protein